MLEYGEILKLLASFSIIVIFIYSIYYYINRSGFGVFGKVGSGKAIKIEEIKHLSKNRSLILVKVKDTVFFLSSDDSGIKKIKEWNEKQDTEENREFDTDKKS
ncbi:flagellar biosynthetic protein FliO [Nitrosophilus alvini]|uniref:flagellar biosynthetic protein FliO n=1 Tax=Nitrosophilus alvini TaxID=2714855 RepID=UPI00190B4884|nr:flagellar biosynthetic protein FliO [Nitrosophilus alvini]